MSITERTGSITEVTDLSQTAKEVVVTLDEVFPCPPGSFVNFFMKVNGVMVRRAYSVVRVDETRKTITFAIRHTLNGTMTPEFWKGDSIGQLVRIMGPLGHNTADKLSKPTLHLVAYGIGSGVIRAILDYAMEKPEITKITLTTGSRNEDDIIYKSYFDMIVATHPHISVRYVISDPKDTTYPYIGYAQDHIDDYDFNNSDVYMCGQEKACSELTKKIQAKKPEHVTYFIEAFH